MAIISIIMITAFIIVYYITYSNTQSENLNKLTKILPIQSQVLAGEPSSNGLGDKKIISNGQVIRNISPDYETSFNVLIDRNGSIVSIDSLIDLPFEAYEEAVNLVLNSNKSSSIIKLDNLAWQFKIDSITYNTTYSSGNYSVSASTNDLIQIAFLDITDSQKSLNNLLITFILVGIVMLIAIFFVSLIFANSSIKPISIAWEKQKQFVADASHELKTPLAIISANTDALLLNEFDTINNQKKWIDYIKFETERMSKLVNDLLYLARTENTTTQTIYTNFNISNILNNVILTMEAIIFEKGITLTQSIEEELSVTGDSGQINQVFVILLDNAIKYVNDKGSIDITLKRSKKGIIFTITNTGIGIKDDALSKIFDRFYRMDEARTHEDGGYGLGLSVAKTIITKTGGKIWAESIENQYTTFTIIL